MPDLVVRPTMDRAQAARARAEGMTRGADGKPSRALELFQCRTAPQGVGAARSLAFPAQLRAKLEDRNGQSLYHLSGVASVTDQPYEMFDFFGSYDEIVAREAFDETLAANPDVAFLVNHKGVTMARTTNGTLELSMGETGLESEAWLNPKRTDVADLVTAIEDRNIDQMSFAFMLDEGWWNDDFTTFKITKLNIDRGDVSAVNYGANPYTSITARSREILDDLERMPVGLARAALERLTARTDLTPSAQSDVEVKAQLERVAPAGPPISTIDAWLASIEARQGY